MMMRMESGRPKPALDFLAGPHPPLTVNYSDLKRYFEELLSLNRDSTKLKPLALPPSSSFSNDFSGK
jgi:hypothetical protein